MRCSMHCMLSCTLSGSFLVSDPISWHTLHRAHLVAQPTYWRHNFFGGSGSIFFFACLLHVHIRHMPHALSFTWPTLKSPNCHLLCSSDSWLGAQSRLIKWSFAMRAAWARRPGNMQRRWKNRPRMLPRLLKKWRCLLQQGRFETPVGLRPGTWLTNPVNFAIISWLFCRLPVKAPKRLWKKPRRTQTHTCMMYTVYMHTCMHTYRHTYIHAYIYIYILMHMLLWKRSPA